MTDNRRWSFVDRPNLENLIGLLMMSGAMCPKCGFGTRKTSKRWRRCKRESCGERLRLEPATPELIATNAKVLKREIQRTNTALRGRI